MSDDRENLILVFLRRLDARLESVEQKVDEIQSRMTDIERQAGRTAAAELGHYANVMARLDRMDTTMNRMKRRLDLADA